MSEHEDNQDQIEGRRVGKYEVLAEIGRGGMGSVYRARLTGLGQASRQVALKVIDPGLHPDSNFVLLFLDEMRMAMSMTHRNIVQTFDAGKLGDRHFLAMELVDGGSLRTLLDAAGPAAPLPLDIAVFIGMEICAALDYAHNHQPDPEQPVGVIHRDISPGNILLSSAGDVKLTDFGVAKAAGRLAVTRDDTVKGKLGYMAPEQAGGSTSVRSDLFALGAVLYEMVSAQSIRPEVGLGNLEAFNEPITPVQQLRPDVSAPLAALISRCLQLSPDDRPTSAKDMRHELQQEQLRLVQAADGQAIDPHARLQAHLELVVGQQLLNKARMGSEPADRLIQAMWARVGQIPTDPGSPALAQESESASPQVEFGTAALPYESSAPGHPGSAHSTSMLLQLPRRALRFWLLLLAAAGLVGVGGAIVWLVVKSDSTTAGPGAQDSHGIVGSTRAEPDARAAASPEPEIVFMLDEADQRARKPPRRRRRSRSKASRSRRGASAQARGLLHLNSRPWTTVVIDGKYRGETPIEGLALRPGKHRVQLTNRKLGLTKRFTIRIEDGQTLRKAVVLSR